MVGKFSDDRMMSGSRIPTLYLWGYKDGHPWSTPNDELRKSIAAKHGEPPEVRDLGDPALIGNWIEDAIVRNAAEELGLPTPLLSPPVIDRSDLFYQCSLDGLTTVPHSLTVFASDLVEIDGGDASIELSGPIPIEAKSTSDYRRGDVPLYRGPIQLQLQMHSVNAEYGILATWHAQKERHIKIYRRDPEMQAILLELCKDFADRVASETFYTPVNIDDCTKSYQGGDTEVRELHSLADDVERLVRLRQDAKELGVQIDALQTKIMQEMQDSEVAVAGERTVKWPTRHYKAQPEKVTPAKEARTIRLKTLQIQ